MIVDAHTLLRTVIASYLKETQRFKIVASLATATEARAYFADVKTPPPDVVLIDMDKDVDFAIRFIEWIKPKTEHLLVYSDYTAYTHVQAAVSAGAAGFIGKDETDEILLTALEQIADGKKYFSQMAMAKTLNGCFASFTAREREVFALVQQAYTNGAIADVLSLNAHTVENYISSLYAKTGVETREELQGL
jgi:DNA-binding NarL/FixJ family response regulator